MAARAVPLLLILAALGCRSAPAPRLEPGSTEALPARVKLPVKGKAQERSLSCESRSSVDLLAAYRIRMSEDAFRLGIPLSDNPDRGFVGDVNGPGGQLPPAGYGVHEEPVAARLQEAGLPVRAHAGVDLDWLRRRLAEGRPVIVWATAQLDTPSPMFAYDREGRPYVAVRGEHTFLAVGYGPGSIYLVDSATGRERDITPRRFDASWGTLGRRAVLPDAPLPR